MRPRVLERLKALNSCRARAAVLDLGGAANPWCDEFVTTYVDMRPVQTARDVLLGDVCDDSFRDSLNGRRWDFVICTHLLEDLRDPAPVVRWVQQIAPAGFIAVPNKHTEVSAVESPQYPGYYHHRWIFTLRGQTLLAVAKLPLLGYYRAANGWLHRMEQGGRLMRGLARRISPGAPPGGTKLPWYDTAKARHGFELGFLWEGGFEFEYINGDYCGPDAEAMDYVYKEALREGL
jgi:hypothetical protein